MHVNYMLSEPNYDAQAIIAAGIFPVLWKNPLGTFFQNIIEAFIEKEEGEGVNERSAYDHCPRTLLGNPHLPSPE